MSAPADDRHRTEPTRRDDERLQAQKMEAIGQLVSGIAHELNNPLAAILGFSELIRQDPSLPADLRQNAELLVEEATRTRRIVQNLLDFARQRPPERYPTSIRALVDIVLTLQSYALTTGGILTEVEIPDDLPTVELDRNQLQLVLVNLTQNAAAAIRRGGGSRIRISAATIEAADPPRIAVSVADDGPGVSPADASRLFEPFVPTPSTGGSGLGLAVSAAIVRAHGGELRHTPSPGGRGAVFAFDLPIRASQGEDGGAGDGSTAVAPAPASVRPAPTADAAPPTVLVVDDEASMRIFLGKALTRLGYTPTVAGSGAEAIALADDGFAVVLCDHQMAGISGVEVYGTLVERFPALAPRFVLMSGDTGHDRVAELTGRRQVRILAKPFDLDTLRRTVAEVIDLDQSRG